jgi:hypothetical protein
MFFCWVNLASGWIAVKMGYPSLWGNTNEIFVEYAAPILYTWALAHWITMLPLTLIVLGMPTWQKPAIIRTRWLCVIGIIACLLVEVKLPVGRFRHIPMVLFPFVDLLSVLVFSFLFHTSRRLQVAIVAIPLVAGSLFLFRDQITRFIPGYAVLVKEVDRELIHKESLIRYVFEVVPAVSPDSYPDAASICEAADELYQQVRITRAETNGYSEVILFWARPGLDSERVASTQPAGTARPTQNGEWACDFKYPK